MIIIGKIPQKLQRFFTPVKKQVGDELRPTDFALGGNESGFIHAIRLLFRR
ncbi:MAG: hypothetical protein JW828_15705 [Sedimentisphaerales bacterium]|nr:hypothetical protein [Sedimentisphaerales bacterium]